MLLFAIAFDVIVDDEREDGKFSKFKIGLIADIRLRGDKSDICLMVEYVPTFTHHRQIFRAWRNDWAGNDNSTIRQLLLLAAIKDRNDPMYVPVSHGLSIIRKVSEAAQVLEAVADGRIKIF